MLTLVLLGLLLAVVQSFVPAAFKAMSNSPQVLAGPQDNLVWTTRGERSQRALRNLHETLPVFLTLGVLSIVLSTGSGLAVWGAVIYLCARVLYVPLLIAGVSGLRSVVYVISLVGLGLMAFAVLPG